MTAPHNQYQPGNASELLPCPFCGEQPRVRTHMDEDLATHNIVEWTTIRCTECEIEFSLPPGYERDPVTQWNTRAAPARCGVQSEPVAWRYGRKDWDGKLWRCSTVPVPFEMPDDWVVQPLYLAPETATGRGAQLATVQSAADVVVRRVAEWDDRTSPDDFPEALLITPSELHQELVRFAEDIGALANPPANCPNKGSEPTAEEIETIMFRVINKLAMTRAQEAYWWLRKEFGSPALSSADRGRE